MQKIELGKDINILFTTPESETFKFGYYNYSPLSGDGNKLLVHKAAFEGRAVSANDEVEIGYYTLDDQKWHKVAVSKAFNWQQGSMLQWLGPDYNKNIIFNDAEEDKYIAWIINIETGEKRKISKAIYGVDPQGKFSISINFERCNFTRAYNYASVVDQKWNQRLPENDGVIRIDLENDTHETIIKLKDIVDLHPDKDEAVSHWFEHIMLNPSGSRFSFYHRYGTATEFDTKCFTANNDGSGIWQHPYSDMERITHLGWMDNAKYVLFTILKSKISAAWAGTNTKKVEPKWYMKLYRSYVKPFMPKGVVSKALPSAKAYYAYTEDQNGIIGKFTLGAYRDGHPSFSRDKRFMLTDTYADKEGYRNLLLYDIQDNKTHLLGRFFSVYNNCGWRADLHPRFSHDETRIVIDSNHNGNHQVLVLGINLENYL